MFLYPEILHLSKKFDSIFLFPMEMKDLSLSYKLPENVFVKQFEMFQPFNRIKILISNFRLILGIYFCELLNSKNKLNFFIQFTQTLNNITHKISVADSLKNELDQINAEKLTCYSYWFNQWALALSIINKKHKKINIYTRIHGMDVYEEQHPEKNFFFQFRTFQIKQIKQILAISDNGMKHFIQANNFHQNKISVSRLGVNDSGINPNTYSTTLKLVSCSALQSYKRVHLIAEILLHVKNPVEWVHFGDGELKDSLLLRTKELPAHVHFKFMGHQSNAALNEYYKNNHTDLFINVSSTEGIPVSIMEAISFGINVIAPEIGGISEIVNEKTGYLIDKDFDPAVIAKMIDNYHLLSAEQKNKKRSEARAFWQEQYHAENNFEKLSSILLQKS